MTLAQHQNITLDQFLELAWIEDSPAWEYINGKDVQKPMEGSKHSTLQKRLVAAIHQSSDQYERLFDKPKRVSNYTYQVG
jgi:Uma2 family endonuclease